MGQNEKKKAGLNNHKMKAEKWKTISPCVKRGLYAFICCREAENWKAIVNSSMWPIPLIAIGHLLLMKNLWSEGGAAVTPNVMFSLFQQSQALSPASVRLRFWLGI